VLDEGLNPDFEVAGQEVVLQWPAPKIFLHIDLESGLEEGDGR
jgi:hypothetical protein